jgi:hypothetical protein
MTYGAEGQIRVAGARVHLGPSRPVRRRDGPDEGRMVVLPWPKAEPPSQVLIYIHVIVTKALQK